MADTRPENDREATERVVLRQIEPGDLLEGRDGWEVIGTVRGSKIQSIDRLAKDQPGKYRSIPLRSWKGGKEIVLPEKPKPESRLFE